MKKNKVKRKIKWKRYIPYYILALPGLIYLICNNYIPMFGITIAFKRLNIAQGFLKSPWCGLDNFKFLFKTSTSFQIIRNTLLYNIVFIIAGMVVSIGAAILLNEVTSRTANKIYQGLMLLPFMISWVVGGYLAYAFLATDTGLFNNIRAMLGWAPINFYQEKKYWPFILLFCNLWKGTGYSMIIYLSSIVSISTDYFEAARVDGASKWQQIRKITLPLIKPTVITLLILSVGRIFASDFGLFYQVPRNSGALYSVTQTIDVYVYNALMKNADFSMSSAASVFQTICGFVLVVLANAVVRKYQRESALF